MSLEIVEAHFDLDALAKQLDSVVKSKDPLRYMNDNINYEIEKDLEPDSGDKMNFKSAFLSESTSAEWNPFRTLINWLKRSRVAKRVKKILCSIAAKIKELIDEEAETKKILGVALTAIVAALGLGAINPVLLTVLVGFLATMILDGVDNFCEI